MDPITHGLTGALVGKAFFAEPYARRTENTPPASAVSAASIAVFAATVGALFPDIDVLDELFSKNDLAILQLHRNFTHSFVCLPVFALVLALLTRWFARRRGWACPSWLALAGIYGAGIATHIFLDLITSFGTMIWSPLSDTRATLDLAFIIDFTMTAIVLVPQVLAWVHRKPLGSLRRALSLWAFFTVAAWMAWRLAGAARYPFSPWVIAVASLAFAALFFVPLRRGWGSQLRRAAWSRAGVGVLAGYLLLCAAAHRAVLRQVEEFAASRGVRVESLGALPLPPSAAHWLGLIRVPDGVYEARITLLGSSQSNEPGFHFVADSAPNPYIEAARQLHAVKIYLWFARFPVYRSWKEGNRAVVEISDMRFFSRRTRRPSPFTFRVTFDSAGHVLEQGWVED